MLAIVVEFLCIFWVCCCAVSVCVLFFFSMGHVAWIK